MEVSVSFTDGTEENDPEVYNIEDSVLGRVFIPKDGVLISGPVRVRYEKHPWMEQFELDGIKAAPARRTGIGTKDAKGFVRSLNTIYAKAYDDYTEFGGDEDFDADAYFSNAADHFLELSHDMRAAKIYRNFCGFVENMWREGDASMYHSAMDVILPKIRTDDTAWKTFEDNITEEFREYIKENNNGE